MVKFLPSLFAVTCFAILIVDAALYENCMSVAACRNLYSQSVFIESSTDPYSPLLTHSLGQNVSAVRFEREMESRAHKIEALLNGIQLPLETNELIELYEAIIIKAILDESKCPPNSYWSWSPEEKKHICRCFIDRDCRASTTTICHDTTHPAMFILLAFACLLLLIDIIVRIVTDRYQNIQ